MVERFSGGLRERLHAGPPLLLDAAMGSDLDRRGLATTLPLWSALGLLERPDLVKLIHLDNLRAGADIVTTNTFRTTGRTLRGAGLNPARAEALDRLAVDLAVAARDETKRAQALIAGSIAPLDDCYHPTFDTAPEIALEEHRAQARNLAGAGVDFIMVETMPTSAEAAIALRAAAETGLPATVSFVCEFVKSGGGVRLLSGETLAEAVAEVEALNPAAILVNCASSVVITAALEELRDLTTHPIGGYANVGYVDNEVGWSPGDGLSSEDYADDAKQWLALGARIVGGCCGTHPVHTAALRRLIDSMPGQ